MKKQVLKCLRLAAKDGILEAKEALRRIKMEGVESYTMQCTGHNGKYTYFKWGFLDITYDGRLDEIRVGYKSCGWIYSD